jgi:hypothetical protein
MSSDAYSAASKEAHQIAKDTAQSIAQEIVYRHEAKIAVSEEELQDLTHETIDSALIYTVTHWVCAWGLSDASDTGISESAEGFDAILAARAYENLSEAVQGFGIMDLARELCEAVEADDAEEIATALAALKAELKN